MEKQSPAKSIIYFISIIIITSGLSVLSVRLWGGKPEKPPEVKNLIIEKDMTIARFGKVNKLSDRMLGIIFRLRGKSDLENKLNQYGSIDEITVMIIKNMALAFEDAGKNWVKIPVKFSLWFVFLASMFIYFRKKKFTPFLRKILLFISLLIFGVIMGSDPAPMGTVKDAIHLYGVSRAVFPPRMIALAVFLIIVLIANKYICAWGCQAGTLQDLLFRVNQDHRRKAVMGRQIKLPFLVTNTVRVVFFAAFTFIAFTWGIDIIEPVDPFKLYKPMYLGIGGGVFLFFLLLAGMFIYRPWCHLFCPFGLAGWLVEKASIVKISIDYKTCIACQKCAAACPSTVMGAILRQDKKTIPDCFACYTCRDICPTGSIEFSTRKRVMPPEDHFKTDKR